MARVRHGGGRQPFPRSRSAQSIRRRRVVVTDTRSSRAPSRSPPAARSPSATPPAPRRHNVLLHGASRPRARRRPVTSGRRTRRCPGTRRARAGRHVHVRRARARTRSTPRATCALRGTVVVVRRRRPRRRRPRRPTPSPTATPTATAVAGRDPAPGTRRSRELVPGRVIDDTADNSVTVGPGGSVDVQLSAGRERPQRRLRREPSRRRARRRPAVSRRPGRRCPRSRCRRAGPATARSPRSAHTRSCAPSTPEMTGSVVVEENAPVPTPTPTPTVTATPTPTATATPHADADADRGRCGRGRGGARARRPGGDGAAVLGEDRLDRRPAPRSPAADRALRVGRVGPGDVDGVQGARAPAQAHVQDGGLRLRALQRQRPLHADRRPTRGKRALQGYRGPIRVTATLRFARSSDRRTLTLAGKDGL